MKIVVTGAAGYIGSATVELLLAEGHHVVGIDSLMHGGESLIHMADHPNLHFVRADIRESSAVRPLLDGADAVVHLAAIVGDPACKVDPEHTRAINYDAAVDLHHWTAKAGVPRFIFASTCSNYGKMEGEGFVTETSPLRPVSLYAETKVAFEKYLYGHSTPQTTAVVLRFSTVYGHSPRTRFDLTVNEFTKDLALGRTLEIFGEQFWRPYCHVRDLARSVLAGIGADLGTGTADVFNVGDTSENYTKKMIVEAIVQRFPDSRVTYVPKNEDPRDYRVNFDKIRDVLGFKITRTVPQGIEEIARLLEFGLIEDTEDQRYYNITPPVYEDARGLRNAPAGRHPDRKASRRGLASRKARQRAK
ncbi:MAG: nucleoside-diphosphate-sugar epimerase [Rhodothermales bacterium]|jgi:nucleoside-diphosphate-sugar epimerase